MSASYRVILAKDLDKPLIDAWQIIQSRNTLFSSPYFCPEFTQLTGQVRDDVRIVVIENDDRITGFFPYQKSLLGIGKPVAGAFSDYHGVIAEHHSEWEIEPLLRAAKLSVWNFDHLVDDTRRFDPHVITWTTSPQIDLSAGYAQFAQGRRDAGTDYIKKTEGLARKLGREVGELRFTLHEPDSEALETLIRWKSAQFRQANLSDAFTVPWTSNLLRRIAGTHTDNFSGVCSVLRAGERIAAIHMGMRSGHIFHYWFPAYDHELAKYSTGIILLLRMAEALAAIGVRTIDLGEGKSPYKERLMTGEVPLQAGFVELPSLLSVARRIQRIGETRIPRSGIPAILRLPLRAIRRLERALKYR